ncbi:MAG: M20/M25/M40 family metallo-hydrolase, partial [Alistipes sp.]|nr:M20/M25/M40 family metallo-hydrolase [Alistipes sp.]
ETLMLNSHIDTVRPAASYTRDPYSPDEECGRIYGLGSNDAGASVAALVETFLAWAHKPLPFNLMLAISAEEERGGERGIRALLPTIDKVDMAIVGEPTDMQAAIGERGLVVLDCKAHGKSGHAAHNEGVNAIYTAIKDIERLQNLKFEKVSSLLGDIRISTTMISAGTQHNIIPDSCSFVVDVRTTDAYTNEEVVEIIANALSSDVTPRSTRIRASAISEEHPLAQTATLAGRKLFVSHTSSDMSRMPFPTLKMGIGDTHRSHSADEYVLRSEIIEGVSIYEDYLTQFTKQYGN